MNHAKRILLISIVLLSCVGCDQATKVIARQYLSESGAISLFNNVFRIEYTENPGAFLSLGANIPDNLKVWLFTIFVGVFLAGILAFLIRSREIPTAQSIAFSLLVGGGVGNLIDRIFNDGRVIDFMNLGVGSLRTGIFNVADIAILVGGILVFADSVRTFEKKKGV